MSHRRTAVPRPAATNRRPVTITRSRTRFPRYAPMMIPRTVRAPSNAPMTKYRRMMGPTFVISSYSRIRRRQAPRSMSSARDPKLLADAPFESFGCGSGLIEVREARLREVGLSPAFAAEFRRDGLEDPGDVHGDIGAPRDDEADVIRRLGPQDRGRPSLGSDRL